MTMVASGGGENAYWDRGPKGQRSSLIRSDPLRRSPIPTRPTAMRQANDLLEITRTSGSIARLQHSTGVFGAASKLSMDGPI